MAFVIEEELRAALLGMANVKAIVDTRIWDEWFRADTLPAIVFEIDSERRENDIGGRGGMVFADVNIVCRANTRSASRALAEAVRVNGDTSPGTGLAGYTKNFDAWLEDMQSAAVPKNDSGTSHWYDMNMSFVISWQEEV